MRTSSVMSLRLDHETRRAIARLARSRRRSQSAVVRDALAALINEEPRTDRPYDDWASVIGIATGGPPDLSERSGSRLRRLLLSRRRRRP